MFSTLRKGASIFILDKTNEPDVKTGYVENVSLPRPMYPTYNPAVSLGTNMQRVVDVTIRVGDETKEFCVPADLSIHTYGDYTLSENKEAMISEIDSLLLKDKEIIESVPRCKQNITSYEKILKTLNPIYAREQEKEERIKDLSDRVDGMYSTLDRLEELLLKISKNGNN